MLYIIAISYCYIYYYKFLYIVFLNVIYLLNCSGYRGSNHSTVGSILEWLEEAFVFGCKKPTFPLDLCLDISGTSTLFSQIIMNGEFIYDYSVHHLKCISISIKILSKYLSIDLPKVYPSVIHHLLV